MQGVVAIGLATGRVRAITAKAIILATGGCGRVYPFTTNASIKTGDGMALAYRVGAPLKDMEFVQYHPTGLPFTGIPYHRGRAGRGWLAAQQGRLPVSAGLQPRQTGTRPGHAEHGARGRETACLSVRPQAEKGRTIDTPYGNVVHLDLRHLGAGLIDAKLPFVRELCLKYQNIDPVTELVPVRPVVLHDGRSPRTDIDGATTVPGLYAAGEVACVSINGANRLGSNSLPELLVFGARAGRAAAEYAASADAPRGSVLLQAEDERRRIGTTCR